jgi:hypothetical protein
VLVGQTQASYRIQSKFSSKHLDVSVIIIFIIITGAYKGKGKVIPLQAYGAQRVLVG